MRSEHARRNDFTLYTITNLQVVQPTLLYETIRSGSLPKKHTVNHNHRKNVVVYKYFNANTQKI